MKLIEKCLLFGFFCAVLFSMLGFTAPVSYTHLDVYKRQTLGQPEQIPQITTIFDEESGQYSYVYPDENTPMVDNPSYPRGTTRAVYQVLYDFLPTSQTFQLSRAETETPWLLALWSLLFTVFITAAGLCLFRRKDIK